MTSPHSQQRQFPALLQALKAQLRARGLRQRDVAERLGVGVATVKRWLAGEGLTTQRLEELCDLAAVTLLELMELAAQAPAHKLHHFTPHQEQTLARDPQLFFIFFSLLNGRNAGECAQELRIAPHKMTAQLQRLERLGLIDRFADGRIRLLASREVAWRKSGPLARYFEIKKRFVNIAQRDEKTLYMSDFFRLSPAGVAQVQQLLDTFRRDLHRIAAADQKIAQEAQIWHGALFLMRPLDMKAIRESFNEA